MYLLQAEYSFLSTLKDEPIALVIVVLGLVFMIIVKITLPKYIEKKAETEIKKIESNERIAIEENNQLIRNMGNVAGKIEEAVIGLTNKYDKLEIILQEQARSIRRMSKQIDLLTLYDNNADILDRLIAFNWCLKEGKNGQCFEFGCKLIVNNKKIWQWVLEHDLYKQPDNERYQKLLAKIDKSIFFI